uniref:Palmitoyltransferase n=1 Tax=Cacopsylla melanoneura TaxID=428564 RepID=A0A8D8PT01_9HEMI
MCLSLGKNICHWGPLLALAIIKTVTASMVMCMMKWWSPLESVTGFINMAIFLSFSGLTMYNFLSAIFEGPGYLPLNWRPESVQDENFLQFCKLCQGYKAPRAHHCRKCGRCVMKMDHHCPWINNCVGHVNHAHFTTFLLSAICGCTHSAIMLSITMYRFINRRYYFLRREPVVNFSLSTLIMTVFSIGLSVGVVIAVGMLFYFQVKAILKNQTNIEDWIVEKASKRKRDEPFVYPYNLGWKKNIQLVFGSRSMSNGISWPLVKGCHQYTLTMEQLEQKNVKKAYSQPVSVVKPYTGRCLPLSYGLKVSWYTPCFDIARLKLQVDQTVLVTRFRKHWLYGEIISNHPPNSTAVVSEKGWFPLTCVVPIQDTIPSDTPQPQEHKKDK